MSAPVIVIGEVMVILLLGVLMMWSNHRTDNGQRETSYERCLVNTRNIWADVQVDRATADRESLLATSASSGTEAYAHGLSSRASRNAANVKIETTAPTEASRRTYCRDQWPRLRFLGVL